MLPKTLNVAKYSTSIVENQICKNIDVLKALSFAPAFFACSKKLTFGFVGKNKFLLCKMDNSVSLQSSSCLVLRLSLLLLLSLFLFLLLLMLLDTSGSITYSGFSNTSLFRSNDMFSLSFNGIPVFEFK